MKHILLLTLVLSLNLSAHVKYITEPTSWDDLQLFQLDSLLDEEELSLSIVCPINLKELQKTYKKADSFSQYILGTNHNWTEFTNTNGLRCLVKHQRLDSINQKDNKTINPNDYEILNVKQARILISASRSIGFKEKGLFGELSQVHLHNQNISSKLYDKYGGAVNLFNYIKNNKPHKKHNEYRKSFKQGIEVTEHLLLSDYFENSYSKEQKNQLIENAIKAKMINTISYDKNKAHKELGYDDFPLEKSEAELEADTTLLNKLKNQIVSPFTFFTYQTYENSQKCKSDFNELKTACMDSQPYYDQENKTITFYFFGVHREIDLKSDIEKIVTNSTNDLARELGIDGKTSGMLQPIIENYDLPITIKKNNLIFNNTKVCIKVSLYAGYDVEGFSYNGLRECNGKTKVKKFIKVYAL